MQLLPRGRAHEDGRDARYQGAYAAVNGHYFG